MEEKEPEAMAPSMEQKEASERSSGRGVYQDVLNAASSMDEEESQKVEGTFTVSDGEVTEEHVVEKAKMLNEAEPNIVDDAVDSEVVAVTAGGKNIQIAKDPVHSGYKIEFSDGGQLPVNLQGRWTNYEKALEAIRIYVGKKNEQEEA